MSTDACKSSSKWVSKRSHLQISHSHVLPVVFKSRSRGASQQETPVPPAFPETEVSLSDAMPFLKQWILDHVDRLYRLAPANHRPGTLETPDLLSDGYRRFTVWLEPTAATYALLTSSTSGPSDPPKKKMRLERKTEASKSLSFNAFTPTPQTLYVIAELDE